MTVSAQYLIANIIYFFTLKKNVAKIYEKCLCNAPTNLTNETLLMNCKTEMMMTLCTSNKKLNNKNTCKVFKAESSRHQDKLVFVAAPR